MMTFKHTHGDGLGVGYCGLFEGLDLTQEMSFSSDATITRITANPDIKHWPATANNTQFCLHQLSLHQHCEPDPRI